MPPSTADLWAEYHAARAEMRAEDRALLAEHGIAPGVAWFLVGAASVRLDSSREHFEPAGAGDAGGAFAFITPVMVEWPDTPEAQYPAQAVRLGELVDLVAWHPSAPDEWALRVGAAEWLGCIEPQCMGQEPVRVFRNVPAWLRGGTYGGGIVPLCRTPGDRYRILTGYASNIEAQDKAHAAELRRAVRYPRPVPIVSYRGTTGACDAP